MDTLSSLRQRDGSRASPLDPGRYPVRMSAAMLSEILTTDSFTQSPASRVALGRLLFRMPEQAPDHGKALAERQRPRRKALTIIPDSE